MGEPIPINPLRVEVVDDALVIHEFIDTDADVVKYVDSSPDGVEATRQLLSVGARSINAASAALDSDTLKRWTADVDKSLETAVSKMAEATGELLNEDDGALTSALDSHSKQLSDLLGAHFDPDSKRSVMGIFEEIMKQAFDTQISNVRRVISLDAADSPLNVMQQNISAEVSKPITDLVQQVQTLSEKIAVNEAVAPVVELSSAKGVKYEQRVHDAVSAIAAQHGDFAEMTGTNEGVCASKKGDEVVTLNLDDTNGVERRFVLEVKASNLSARKTQDELDGALANRDAQAAIIVFDSQAKAPTSVPFHESGNKAIVVFDEETGIHSLRLSYMWARWVVRRIDSDRESDSLDMTSISQSFEKAQKAINRHSTIKSNHTKARKSIDLASNEVELLVDDVTDALSELEDELSEAGVKL